MDKIMVTSVRKPVSFMDIPPGTYPGEHHGYEVTFEVNGSLYYLHVDVGVRGWAKCLVIVTGDGITVTGGNQ